MQFNKSMFVLQGERKSPLKFMSKSVFDTKRIVCITWNRRNQFSCYGTCHHANCHDWPWKWKRWKKLNQTKFLESPFRYWKSINIHIKGHYWQIKTYPHRQKISYDLQIWNKKAEMHPNASYGSYNGIQEYSPRKLKRMLSQTLREHHSGLKPSNKYWNNMSLLIRSLRR